MTNKPEKPYQPPKKKTAKDEFLNSTMPLQKGSAVFPLLDQRVLLDATDFVKNDGKTINIIMLASEHKPVRHDADVSENEDGRDKRTYTEAQEMTREAALPKLEIMKAALEKNDYTFSRKIKNSFDDPVWVFTPPKGMKPAELFDSVEAICDAIHNPGAAAQPPAFTEKHLPRPKPQQGEKSETELQ